MLLSWDDYYQMQKSKGREVDMPSALFSFKAEHDAFNASWKKSAQHGQYGVSGEVWWSNADAEGPGVAEA